MRKLKRYTEQLLSRQHISTRLKWCVKQLLPLRYTSRFVEDGKRHVCIWRMWFGRCFDVQDFILADE